MLSLKLPSVPCLIKYCNIKTLLIIFTIWFGIILIIASKLLMSEYSHFHKSSSPLIINNKPKQSHQIPITLTTSSSSTASLSSSTTTDNIPGLPAFVVIGPPKSGTTSLVHTLTTRLNNFHLYITDNGENHFWSGSNNYVCLPDYCDITWKSFINAWKESKVSLTFLNHSIWTGSILDPQLCTKSKYETIWQWIMCHEYKNVTDKLCQVPYIHHKEMYCKKSKDAIIKSLPYCYFIESAPSYLRNPLIGIMYAMNMPKIKLLGIFIFFPHSLSIHVSYV